MLWVFSIIILGLSPVSLLRALDSHRSSPISNLSEIRSAVSCLHMGWGNFGQFPMEDWARVMVENQINVLGIFETDGMRSVMDNRDPVEYLNHRLHFAEDYGPPSSENTWGCSFLSLFPIKRSEKMVLPSPYGELACGVDADILVNNTLVRVITAHFGNTEDVIDLELQTEEMVQRIKNSSHSTDLRPLIFISYITSSPYESRHIRLLQSGLMDSTNSLDRYCLYTMYRDIELTSFKRLDKSIRSDTEIQMSSYLLKNEKFPIAHENMKVECRKHFDDFVGCQKTTSCGWCQIGSSGSCYEASPETFHGCNFFEGSWIGTNSFEGSSKVTDLNSHVRKFFNIQSYQLSKGSNRIEKSSNNTLDYIWTITNLKEVSSFVTEYSSPLFSKGEGYWRLRMKFEKGFLGLFIDCFPNVLKKGGSLESNWSISGRFKLVVQPDDSRNIQFGNNIN